MKSWREGRFNGVRFLVRADKVITWNPVEIINHLSHTHTHTLGYFPGIKVIYIYGIRSFSAYLLLADCFLTLLCTHSISTCLVSRTLFFFPRVVFRPATRPLVLSSTSSPLGILLGIKFTSVKFEYEHFQWLLEVWQGKKKLALKVHLDFSSQLRLSPRGISLSPWNLRYKLSELVQRTFFSLWRFYFLNVNKFVHRRNGNLLLLLLPPRTQVHGKNLEHPDFS